MVKNIILHVDDKFFLKLKVGKAKLEEEEGISMTWEEYIRALFDMWC